MIDSSLWEILVTFYECGTLSAAAEKLFVSQPSLSAAMKRLEKELNVCLFDRSSKNRLTLNEVGLEAVQLAQQHIRAENAMIRQLQETARRLNALTVASCENGLCSALCQTLSALYPEKEIVSESVPGEMLAHGLQEGRFDLAISASPISEPGILCLPYQTDRLMVRLYPGDPLAGRSSVTLQDLQDSKLLMWTQNGFWSSFIRRKLGDRLQLVFVNSEQEYHDIVEAFDVRAFLLQSTLSNSVDQYHCVPLKEDGMQVPFYLCCMEKHEHLLMRLLAR